jgi:hypothetical protein
MDLNTRRSYRRRSRLAHASRTIAMTMPINTNTTIATCIQTHVGDTRAQASVREAARGAGGAHIV